MKAKWLLAAAIVALSTLGLATTAQAKSVTYSALTYGTNKTSMASKYFVRPAKVTVKNGKYYVTMRLKTANALGKYPVKVLKANGQTPQNLKKVHQSGSYNLYYSFTATASQMKNKITAKLAINVLYVYKAKHNISFKFKQSQLPSLKKQKHTSQAAVAAATTSSSSAKKAQALLPAIPNPLLAAV